MSDAELLGLALPGAGGARAESLGISRYEPGVFRHNCIAWAAGDTSRWWWPDAFFVAYWPPGVPREDTVAAVAPPCESLGYRECDDAGVEPEHEKVAIYAVGDQPKHAARQLPGGLWTSKLGQGVDIEHTLEGLEGALRDENDPPLCQR